VKVIFLILAFASLVFIGNSCVDDTPDATSKLKVRICDGPSSNFKSVIIDIQAVQVKITSDSNMSGWKTLDNTNIGQYDLMSLTNGKDSLIASQDLSTGSISQLKLVLGTKNKVVLNDGTEKPLYLLASQLNQLRLDVSALLYADQTCEIFVDIDVSRSIRIDDSGAYFFFPSVRTFKKSTTGTVLGNLTPKTIDCYAYLISETDTLGGSISKNGSFQIRGITPGTNYQLVVMPISNEDYSKLTANNVEVINNTITSYNLTLRKKGN